MERIYQMVWQAAKARSMRCRVCGEPVTRDCSECFAPLCADHVDQWGTCGGPSCEARVVSRARRCAA